MKAQSIISLRKIGVRPSIDFEVNHKDHNFYAEGIVNGNSHSLSYSHSSSNCVLLKTLYPKEFFLTCLEMAKGTEDFALISGEVGRYGLSIGGPSLLHSELGFTCKENKIYFGLGSVKGVSKATLSKLDTFRRDFTNKFEIFSEAKVLGIGIFSNLIYSGCLDDFLTETRSKTVLEACVWNELTDKEKIECLKRGSEFKYNLFEIIKALNKTIKTEKGKPIIKDSRLDTLRRDTKKFVEIYKNNSKHEDFTVFEMESRLLGFSYSQTLQKVYRDLEPNLEEIEVVKSYGPKERVVFVGKVKFAAEGLTKKAQMPYFRCVVADQTGEITVFIYENDRFPGISRHKELNGRLAKEDDVVVVRGQRSGDDIVNADNIAVQEVKVFAKASELPSEEEKIEQIMTNLAPKT